MDTKIYSVTGINGFRRGNLTLEEAAFLQSSMSRMMRENGWTGKVRIYYRDGTECDSKGCPVR